MDPVDETSELRLEIGDLVLEVEILVSDIATGLGDTTDIFDEFLVAESQAFVVSTDGRSDEFSDESELIVVHGGEIENERECSAERRVVKMIGERTNEVLP